MLSPGWSRSSIGKKSLMAASGLALVGFIIAHLLGNLLIYAGPDVLNAYAVHLRELGPVLWAARLLLITAVLIHIWTSIKLNIENRQARPVPYAKREPLESSFSARTMLASGFLIVAYVTYHLLHFTFRMTNPDISHAVDAAGRPDVYLMVVRSFQQPGIALAYIVGMACVCTHLAHGVGSAFQTLGLTNERTIPIFWQASRTFSLAVFLGYISIPLSVWFGVVK